MSEIKFVEQFEYLGVLIQHTGSGDSAVRPRLDKASKASWSLNSSVWSLKQVSLTTKVRVYRARLLSVLLYCSEAHTYRVRLLLEKIPYDLPPTPVWLRYSFSEGALAV